MHVRNANADACAYHMWTIAAFTNPQEVPLPPKSFLKAPYGWTTLRHRMLMFASKVIGGEVMHHPVSVFNPFHEVMQIDQAAKLVMLSCDLC